MAEVSDVNAQDMDRMRQAAELLLKARRTTVPIESLPEPLRPGSLEEAYVLQDLIAEAMGDIGGWKIGVPNPEATPLFGPMPVMGGFAKTGDTLLGTFRRLRGLEAEIAFCFGQDLPPRDEPYSREEVIAAIASCHPAIEILESGFTDPDKVDRLSMIGDLQMNGGFVYGEPVANWHEIDFGAEGVTISVDGAVRVEARGSCGAGSDLVRLLVWLANEGQHRTGGLDAGDWVTTGSWTGKTTAEAHSQAQARFEHCGAVSIRFSESAGAYLQL
jgi:2-keto-4-pentenoate hydratase